MSYAKRVDSNQAPIVAALRKAGRPVRVMSGVGHGFPDLMTRHVRGHLVLLEVKDGSKEPARQALTELEALFFAEWPGVAFVVKSEDDALRAVGLSPGAPST